MRNPTVDTMARRVLACWHAASAETAVAGRMWYQTARCSAEAFSERYGHSVDVCACVIAAHSANTAWAENLARAERQLAGRPVGLRRSIAMAAAAMANPDNPFAHITGPKLQPFAYCVAGNEQHVATDRWAQRAAFGTSDDRTCERLIRRKGVRADVIAAYCKAAADVGVSPAVMQATVWVHVRGKAE